MGLLAAGLCLALAQGPSEAALLIQGDVERLASRQWKGRRAGTKEAEQAATWIAQQWKRLGLEPAFSGSYLQSFGFIDGVVLGKSNRLEVNRRAFRSGRDFRPLAFSAPGRASGAVVFAGYGIVAKELGFDEYEGLDARGRIVLALRYSPGGDDSQSQWGAFMALRLKAAAARERGASALLVVAGPLTPGAEDELVPARADASLVDAGLPVLSVRRPVAEALFAGAGLSLEEAQRRVDAGRPASLPLATRASLEADVAPKRATSTNVAALLPGTDPDAGAVVVGAHYDHLGLGLSGSLDPSPVGKIHHGADDNASGVAGVLELARRLAPQRGRLQRSVLFVAFGAEELGTLGSSYFVKHPPLPLERIVAMANLDMVGRLRDETLDVHGLGTSPAWKPLLEEANREPALKLRLHEGGFGPSDHNAFYVADRPVLFFFTGVHADYHKPSDTADKLEAQGLVRVVDVVEGVLTGLAAGATPVAFTRVAAEKETQLAASRGFRVYVGGIPDYASEGPGVGISGVSPGSPAERAGLQKGDVIVGFAGREIRTIYDYTQALSERKPGDEVELRVRRAQAELVLRVVLGTRPSAAR
jgi:hypothetical protein